jgi:hypothetical protein
MTGKKPVNGIFELPPELGRHITDTFQAPDIHLISIE